MTAGWCYGKIFSALARIWINTVFNVIFNKIYRVINIWRWYRGIFCLFPMIFLNVYKVTIGNDAVTKALITFLNNSSIMYCINPLTGFLNWKCGPLEILRQAQYNYRYLYQCSCSYWLMYLVLQWWFLDMCYLCFCHFPLACSYA